MAVMSRAEMKAKLSSLALGLLLVSGARARACDPCALYNVSQLHASSKGAVRLSISEQLTSYEESDGGRRPRDGEITETYGTTLLTAQYDFTDRLGAQASVPLIYRSFDRYEEFRKSEDSEGGLGDISLVAHYAAWQAVQPDYGVRLGFYGGVELPSGDTGSLGDIQQEEHAEHHIAARHHAAAIAGGGRALSLGSGSFDFPLGVSFYARRERLLWFSVFQYTLRTRGSFDYEFADDIVWSAGPGYYLSLDDTSSLALLAAFSGEHKGEDELESEKVDGTDLSNLFLGPYLLFSAGDAFGELGLELPVYRDESAEIVPEYRLRASLGWRF